MATEAKTVMAWSQCKIEIGKTGANDAMATSLTDVGYVQENSASLNTDLGTALEAYASGHKLVAREYPQETLTLEFTVIEPTAELLTLLGIGTEAEGTTKITSHVITDFFSVKVTPKHKGAKGIQAPKANITYAPQFGEETGNLAVLTVEIAKTTDADENYWYEKFTTTEELA